MLIPKKVNIVSGRRTLPQAPVETRGLELSYGQFGLKSTESAWITSRQIEAARKTITNYLKRDGRMWIRIFPDSRHASRLTGKHLSGHGALTSSSVFREPARVIS